jgi:PBSX family phage terminase large subunit
MSEQLPFAPKQVEFLINSTHKWNFAHGSVRSGKTICTLFRFMQAVHFCPDSKIWMIGYTGKTIYNNAIKLIFEDDILSPFRPFCTWHTGEGVLTYKDKKILTTGADNEGAVGKIQGQTMSLCYCDEMTLFPDSMIHMIDNRLSQPHSMGFAAMNPSHPEHPIKKWIDRGLEGDKNYYSLHFTLDDNPFVEEDYKERIRRSHSGLSYKRNYLGLWCLAEGAIFDFFDTDIHVLDRPPRAAEYYVCGIDVGTSNAFACLLLGVSTGKDEQSGKKLWVEKEFYWDSKSQGRQMTNSEYADAVQNMLEPYGNIKVYIDPSAAAFKEELRRRKIHPVEAKNDVLYGINMMTSEMQKGNLYVLKECKNTIKEIQSYVWDTKKAKLGEDAPLKQNDHACDALRYVLATHKVSGFDEQQFYKSQQEELRKKYHPGGYGFR